MVCAVASAGQLSAAIIKLAAQIMRTLKKRNITHPLCNFARACRRGAKGSHENAITMSGLICPP